MHSVNPPHTEFELQQRAEALVGKTLGEVASTYNYKIPKTLTQAKGFIGQLIEHHLGATAGNKSEPDFQELGIELKTLPLNANGSPRESTYVCTAPFYSDNHESWLTSRVRKKLAKVFWFPIEGDPQIAIPARRFGSPILWHLDTETEQILKEDWEELMTMLQMGQAENLSAHLGTYLQIRPKAAHSRILSKTITETGDETLLNPKGFYLRVSFTKTILEKYYCFI